MEDYRNAFIEEANDFVHILEESLLQLESDKHNTEIVNEIFRVMHSLKGSGAMFGFDDLSAYTHHLESLYDKVREGEIFINSALIDFTFESVDHIKHLISSSPDEKLNRKSQTLIDRIPTIISNSKTKEEGILESAPRAANGNRNAIKKEQVKSYFIRFKPDKEILKDGTNPLYLIDELVSMGNCLVKVRDEALPALDEFDPLACYFSWDIVLSTKEDPSSIDDVFIFVSDTCEIEIEAIADFDMLENEDSKSKIEELLAKQDVSAAELKEVLPKEESSILIQGEIEAEESEIEVPELQANAEEENNVFSVRKMRVSTVRVKAQNLDMMINLVSELVTMQARMQTIAQEKGDLELLSVSENFQKLNRQFRDLSFEMRLVPLQNLFVKFQRLVNDVSKELNKDVDFVTEGLETELDKNVIEQISEPILHILRNSLDHGIEELEVRRELNKAEKATIQLKAFYSGADVIIQLQDDGRGIDPRKIKQIAISNGLITESAKLSDKEILELVFAPGFSTKKDVSSLSGRGVGMDVVKRKIEELRGSVDIDSELEKGTTITIRLPLTLSMIDGFLVMINTNSYIIPLSAIDKIHELRPEQLEKAFNNMVEIEGEQIPFITLKDNSQNGSQSNSAKYLLLINFENQKVGLVVNEVFGEHQVVLKPLGHFMKTKDYFSGATILGDGKVALVIDTNKLIQYTTR